MKNAARGKKLRKQYIFSVCDVVAIKKKTKKHLNKLLLHEALLHCSLHFYSKSRELHVNLSPMKLYFRYHGCLNNLC